MRIGLYGMPTAGKSYILDKVDFLEVMSGSVLLREICPTFDSEDDHGKNKWIENCQYNHCQNCYPYSSFCVFFYTIPK